MAVYEQKYASEEVIIELANPEGVINVKKDKFKCSSDYVPVLYDENFNLVGVVEHLTEAAIDKNHFRAIKKPLFSSNIKAYLFFMNKNYLKGITIKWPIYEITPPEDTVISWNGGKSRNKAFGNVKVFVEIDHHNVMRELNKGGLFKKDNPVVFSKSNMNAVCQGCIKAALGNFNYETVDVASSIRVADRAFNLAYCSASNSHFVKNFNFAMNKVNENVFPNSFHLSVVNSGYNYK